MAEPFLCTFSQLNSLYQLLEKIKKENQHDQIHSQVPVVYDHI